jgi:hypothetical protein
MYYLMLSVLLAIVLDSYHEIKRGWSIGLPVWEELRSVFRLWKARRAQGETVPRPLRHLRGVAEKLAESDRVVFTVIVGLSRIVALYYLLIHFIPESLTHSVPLFLK